VFLAIALIGAAFGTAVLLSSRIPAPGTDLADLLRKNPTEYDLSLGHFLDLTPEAMGAFRWPLLGTVVFLPIGAGVNWWLRRKSRPRLANAALALMMIGVLACVHSAFSTFSTILSSHDLAVAIRQHYEPGDLIVVDGQYHEASTLHFYTGVPLRVLHVPSGNLWYGSKFPDAPNVFETRDSFARVWSGPQMVFLWTDQELPEEIRDTQHFLLARSGGKSIFTNHRVTN
jgi:hypothetical protein